MEKRVAAMHRFLQANKHCILRRPSMREQNMRKKVINQNAVTSVSQSQPTWLNLEKIAAAEVTSEDPGLPIEAALTAKGGSGWRAGEPGEQVIRMLFDQPIAVHRIRLEFSENEVKRTQEFTLRWSRANEPSREIVRQQWNFSPQGSTSEVEDYPVNLNGVSVLELKLKPDVSRSGAFATLVAWRVA